MVSSGQQAVNNCLFSQEHLTSFSQSMAFFSISDFSFSFGVTAFWKELLQFYRYLSWFLPLDLQTEKFLQVAGQCLDVFWFTNYIDLRVLGVISTVKPLLETTCIKQSTALRDPCSDTTAFLNSTEWNLHLKTTCSKRQLLLLLLAGLWIQVILYLKPLPFPIKAYAH